MTARLLRGLGLLLRSACRWPAGQRLPRPAPQERFCGPVTRDDRMHWYV